MGNYMILWIIAVILFIILEITTVGLSSIWFAIGALFALIAAILKWSFFWQLIVFTAVSILTLIFTRPVLVKKMKLGNEKTNIDQLINATGIVIEEIGEFHTGLVKMNEQIWSAKSINGEIIHKDQIVVVDHIEGVKLIVKIKI